MTTKQLYYALMGGLCLIVVAMFGSAYGINKLLEEKSSKLVTLKTNQAALTQQQTQLIQMKKDIVTYNSLYDISRIIVPQSKDQTETVRQIVGLAARNGVTLQSITFPASSLGAGTSSLGVSTTGSSGAAAAPVVAGASSNPALSQLQKIANIPGVYDLPIQVVSSNDPNHMAGYSQVIKFLSSLEQNRLTAQVSSIDLQPDAQNPSRLSFTLSLDIFINPEVTK
ncbi:MAG TPA: hypothetical protein VLG27_01250 [Candidatus Saccharimonadia bacterium]|nr:hypothetical protein [Candidatus Saccharimonadia bacterium]